MTLGNLKVKKSVIRGKNHPHHVGENIRNLRTRQIKNGLKCFRDDKKA